MCKVVEAGLRLLFRERSRGYHASYSMNGSLGRGGSYFFCGRRAYWWELGVEIGGFGQDTPLQVALLCAAFIRRCTVP